MNPTLYCDESIWIPVVEGLRRRGWAVRTARGEGRLSRSDRDHLAHAVDNDWILFTFDNDFLRLVEGEGLEHAGIVYTDQAGMKVGDVVRAVDTFLEGLDPEWRGVHYL